MPADGAPLAVPTAEVLQRLADVVGPAHAIADRDVQQPYLVERRDKYLGRTPLVLRPGTVEEVSRILAIANEARVGVVPQGGNTGLVGGQVPFESGAEIVLSLSRIDRLREIDGPGLTMTVEAGMTLADVRTRADAVGCLFPLSLPSEGTCQIGGNLATNAGGAGVLAYGNARNLVLGLEVVLADGRVWNGLRALKKDNTGYDLRDLFIGSEGTLGVITAAVLKLFPRPERQATAMLGVGSLETALVVFGRLQARFGASLTAFEFIPAIALDFVTRHNVDARSPFVERHSWNLLVEISTTESDDASALEDALGTLVDSGEIKGAVVAHSLRQARDLWRLREGISDAQRPEGGSIKHDVSVPISSIPAFVARAAEIVERVAPGARPVPFGHFGDGNIHYNVSQPHGGDKAAFLELWEKLSHEIHGLVHEMGGSISAEHGIGRMKADDLVRFKSKVELDMMGAIKAALDPRGILNPGKVLK